MMDVMSDERCDDDEMIAFDWWWWSKWWENPRNTPPFWCFHIIFWYLHVELHLYIEYEACIGVYKHVNGPKCNPRLSAIKKLWSRFVSFGMEAAYDDCSSSPRIQLSMIMSNILPYQTMPRCAIGRAKARNFGPSTQHSSYWSCGCLYKQGRSHGSHECISGCSQDNLQCRG